jgi:hypothetical protein
MRIALIVDSSETAGQSLNQFRAGLRSFYDELPPETEVALMTIGRQARMRLTPTTDRRKLLESASGFFADGGGTAALDGVLEGYSRILRRAEGRWPVMVLVTTDGPIAGSVREDELERLLNDLQAASVTVHAIVVSTRGNGVPTIIALNVTEATGGHYEAIAVASALPDKMKALGKRLVAQALGATSVYRVEYLSDTEGPRGVEVGVSRSGVRLSVSDRRAIK